MYRFQQNAPNKDALDRGLAFFSKLSVPGPERDTLIIAYHLAKNRNLTAALNDLAYTIDTGLYKLTGWQVGGPLQHTNRFLVQHPTSDPLAIGGIMNHNQQAPLRIDVTQHQMHAVILALRYVYTARQ